MKIVGKGYRLEEFGDYLKSLRWTSWVPSLVVIHHTAAPSLAQRPSGFLSEHMLNLKDYYEGKGWSAGPHLFVDEDQAWVFTPLTRRGVHAVSFNRTAIGIEMLGDYDSEDPLTGRGAQVLRMTSQVTARLIRHLILGVGAIRFHRDDPRTLKTCPGKKVSKPQFVASVSSALLDLRP